MTVQSWFLRFWADDKTAILAVLIAVDLVLGILAAFKVGQFRLSYISDYLRKDVLFKVVPYFVVYGGMLATRGRDVILDFIDLGDIAMGLWVGIMAALAGSILNSLATLKDAPAQKQSARVALAADEGV